MPSADVYWKKERNIKKIEQVRKRAGALSLGHRRQEERGGKDFAGGAATQILRET